MNETLRVLIVEDSPDDADLLVRELKRGGYDCDAKRVETAEEMKAALGQEKWDLILSDYALPNFSGPAALELLKASGLDLPFIIVSGTIGEETAVESLKAGAHDFMLKNKLARLIPAIRRELADAEVRRARKSAENQLQRQLERLEALRTIDMAITSSLDVRVTLNVFLDQVTTQLGVDAADVLLLHPATKNLKFAAGRGFRSSTVNQMEPRLGEGPAGRAAMERTIVSVPDLRKETSSFPYSRALAGEGFTSYYAAPLVTKGRAIGVLEIFHRAPLHPDDEWLGFLEALASQAAIAVENAELFSDLERKNDELVIAYDATLEGWVHALDLRDKETEGHSERVVGMTLQVARDMGIGEEEIVHVRRGALLHDIGKIAIPDSILLKPGPLTDEEWVIMRKHPVHAFEWLNPIPYLRPALDIPYSHHEKWDGTGYPRGLKGERIPLPARIFAVVDVWDALSSDRPYRNAWPKEKVRDHIRTGAGSHFDPRILTTFLNITSE
ncbi:MAG: HD domain-containing phosphohydrolase [bacterium]